VARAKYIGNFGCVRLLWFEGGGNGAMQNPRAQTLRSRAAGSQDESPCGAIHKIALLRGQAYATNGKFVSNRKLFLLCFQQSSQRNDDSGSFICIE
jgi:hypothetical protein